MAPEAATASSFVGNRTHPHDTGKNYQAKATQNTTRGEHSYESYIFQLRGFLGHVWAERPTSLHLKIG